MLKKTLIAAVMTTFSFTAFAGNFFVVLPNPIKKSVTIPPQTLSVSLGAFSLAPAKVGKPYSPFDFNTLLQVTGDPSYNKADVSWSLAGGTLPAGMSMSAGGLLSGTPTVVNETGSSVQVKATYKTKSGQQSYTIIVNDVVLRVNQLAAGLYHTCGLTTTGGVKCWGSNSSGQLGNNSTVDSLVPVDVVGLTSGVTSVTAGFFHSCATTSSGAVKCWGRDSFGQLGNGDTANSAVPVSVSGLGSEVASISSGGYHTCARTAVGGAKCWGYNANGQLGNGTTVDSLVPVDVTGLTSGVAYLAANGYHSCVVTTGGGVKCWGDDANGQLGDNSTLSSSLPVDVSGLSSGISRVALGLAHTCALTSGGGAKCWGAGTAGQLGNGSTASSKVPVDVNGLSSGVGILSAGSNHTCIITTGGAAKCWGSNTAGQLGNSTITNSLTPVDVTGLNAGVSSISAGGVHTCAMATVGALCWGFNANGQIGNDSTVNTSSPVMVLKP